jgi:hypothetical protein
MSFAENYHRWILESLKPQLGTRLVEVGAGSGSFSDLLLDHPADSLALIEPSEAMHRLLAERIRSRNDTRVETYRATFGDVAERLSSDLPDSIIYVNVLEHIADDVGELACIGLSPQGERSSSSCRPFSRCTAPLTSRWDITVVTPGLSLSTSASEQAFGLSTRGTSTFSASFRGG